MKFILWEIFFFFEMNLKTQLIFIFFEMNFIFIFFYILIK
jgi:hypothetical protein